jgi:putative transposase
MSTSRDPPYRRHRFPPEVISYAVWLYFRFPLSLRMVEEMLAARGICVTYETVRQWGKKFGKAFSDQIRQRAPVRGDKWHMDEVGHLDCWRAVLAVARRRSKSLRSPRLRPLSKRQSRCAAVHEEALEIRRHTAARHDHGQARSYGAARAQDGPLRRTSPAQGPEQSHGEQSHGKLSPADKATRTDHEAIQSAQQAQRFLSVHDQVASLFHIPYPKSVPADFRRSSRERAFAAWREISKTGATA